MKNKHQQQEKTHDPVLLDEILHEFGLSNALLKPSTKKLSITDQKLDDQNRLTNKDKQKMFIDGTVGLAGHSV